MMMRVEDNEEDDDDEGSKERRTLAEIAPRQKTEIASGAFCRCRLDQ